MRLLIVSDLHLEFRDSIYQPPGSDLYDAAILAGDITNLRFAGQHLPRLFPSDKPIVYVPGNHEYYGLDIETALGVCRGDLPDNFRVLCDQEAVIDGVRFVGATLWTDYALYGDALHGMDIAQESMVDHQRILHGITLFQAADSFARHRASRAYIADALAVPFEGPTVVVTHHAPSGRSIAAQWRDSPINPAFASELPGELFFTVPTLWVHGHTHSSVDYRVGNCRVVANPAGYPRSGGARENPDFNQGFIIDV